MSGNHKGVAALRMKEQTLPCTFTASLAMQKYKVPIANLQIVNTAKSLIFILCAIRSQCISYVIDINYKQQKHHNSHNCLALCLHCQDYSH